MKFLTRICWAVIILAILSFIAGYCFADGVYLSKAQRDRDAVLRVLQARLDGLRRSRGGDVFITDAPKPDDLVPVGASSNRLGKQSFWYSTPVVTWQKWSSVTEQSVIGTCEGAERNVEKCAFGNGGNSSLQVRSRVTGLVLALPAPVFAYKPPPCIPKSLEEVRIRVTMVPPKFYVMAFCDRPTGIERVYRVFSFSNDAPAVPDLTVRTSSELLILDKAIVNRFATSDENAIAIEMDRDNGIKAFVWNGTNATAPLYAQPGRYARCSSEERRQRRERSRDARGEARRVQLADASAAVRWRDRCRHGILCRRGRARSLCALQGRGAISK